MLRRDSGTPIRTAMNRAGLDIKALAAKTREVDPEGRGISKTLIGYALTSGKTAREEFSERASILISTALDEPLGRLFHLEDSGTSSESASASPSRLRDEMTSGPPLEPLLDTEGLAKALTKSPSWVYRQRREHPRGSAKPFPFHMVGYSPRYRMSEVLVWCEAVYADDSVAAYLLFTAASPGSHPRTDGLHHLLTRSLVDQGGAMPSHLTQDSLIAALALLRRTHPDLPTISWDITNHPMVAPLRGSVFFGGDDREVMAMFAERLGGEIDPQYPFTDQGRAMQALSLKTSFAEVAIEIRGAMPLLALVVA